MPTPTEPKKMPPAQVPRGSEVSTLRANRYSAQPDAWFPFYGDEFFAACAMFGDETSLKYLRCLWFYWSHTHCEGLPDDDEMLRNLCRCNEVQWTRAKRLLFDNALFFKLENGKWHQKRARQEWEKRNDSYQRRLKQTAAATATRAKSKNVTSDVTSDVTSTKLQLEDNSSHTQPGGFAERPSLEEVKAYAQQIGLALWKAEDWFDEMEAGGWLDYQHRPIASWQAALRRVKVKWEADGRPTSPPSRQPQASTTNQPKPRRPFTTGELDTASL